MLLRGEDYAFVRPSLVREKLQRLELLPGAERHRGARTGVFAERTQHRLEKELAAHLEAAYERLVKDWIPSGARPTNSSALRHPRGETIFVKTFDDECGIVAAEADRVR